MCSVEYPSLEFAARIGHDLYERVFCSTAGDLVGEAIFRSAAFPDSRRGVPPMEPEAERCARAVPAFIEDSVAAILRRDPRVVGFSSVFQQNLACIALARRIKQERPDVATVLGGPNAARPMGPALVDVTDAFDVVVSGEADREFPRLCARLLCDGPPSTPFVLDCDPITRMDDVAVPDYSDYFAQLRPLVDRGALPGHLPVCVHFESSRGCWWGERSHCTFCGLNGLEIGYRAKTPGRILDEAQELVTRYGVMQLNATDNIMSTTFVRDVLPALARRTGGARFYFEVKANLRGRDLDAFVRAGVHAIQPGIESLSSRVLQLIAKGVRGIHNVRLLRDCGSRGIRVDWNLLAGAPGESAQDYRAMLDLFPRIEHLQPPLSLNPIRFDRFSPYATAPERYGLSDLRPLPAYTRLYPDGARVGDIAYHFEADHTTPFLSDAALFASVRDAVARWRAPWERGTPPRLAGVQIQGTGAWRVEDTRACAASRVHLLPPDAVRVLERAEEPLIEDRLDPAERTLLARLRALGLVIDHEGATMSIVTRPQLGQALHREFIESARCVHPAVDEGERVANAT